MVRKWIVWSVLIALLSRIAPLGFAQEDLDLPQTISGQGLTFNYPEDWYALNEDGATFLTNKSWLFTSAQSKPTTGEFLMSIFPPSMLGSVDI